MDRHEPDNDDAPMVTLCQTTDPGLLPVLESVLEAAGIPFIVQGEAGLELFPLGGMGGSRSGAGLGTRILVPEDRKEEAQALIKTGSQPG